MRKLTRVLLVAAILALVLAVPGVALSKASRTPASMAQCNFETVDWGYSQIIGDKLVITGIHNEADMISSDPRLSGRMYNTSMLVLDPGTWLGDGYCKFEIVNQDGSWKGQCLGHIYPERNEIKFTGKGTGDYAGLTLQGKMGRLFSEPCEHGTAYIVEGKVTP